jgi:hypothetical protein
MPQPDAFALIITSTLISVGVASSFAQMAIILTLYGRYGFMTQVEGSGDTEYRFLSDTFALDHGLANTWLMAMIPSVAVASIIIHTALDRNRKRMCVGSDNTIIIKFVALWSTVLVTQLGLIMLVLYNVVWKKEEHFTGVILCVVGGLILNVWVIILDYGVTRNRWHPRIFFDLLVFFTTTLAIYLFVQPMINTSVLGEWILLVVVWASHTLMPFRGARIVLSPSRAQGYIVWSQ